MMPLYAFVQGDTLGLLVLAREEATVAELAEELQSLAQVRVPRRASVAVVHGGRQLPPNATVSECQMQPLDRVDLVEVPSS
jgi:hypothetical protein